MMATNANSTPVSAMSNSAPGAAKTPDSFLFELIADADQKMRETDDVLFAAKKASPAREHFYESASREAFERCEALRNTLTAIEATSSEMAAVQISEAILRIDNLDNTGDEGVRAVNRLLYSALRFIEKSSGVTVEELGLECLRQRNLDPWEPTGART